MTYQHERGKNLDKGTVEAGRLTEVDLAVKSLADVCKNVHGLVEESQVQPDKRPVSVPVPAKGMFRLDA